MKQRWILVTFCLVLVALGISSRQLPLIRADSPLRTAADDCRPWNLPPDPGNFFDPTPICTPPGAVYVPSANGPMQTPTPTQTPSVTPTPTVTTTPVATATSTRTPAPAPGDPSEFSVALVNGSQMRVRWLPPSNSPDLRYSYAVCNFPNPCNRATFPNLFVSDFQPLPSGSGAVTITFNGIQAGASCIWIRHRFGSSGAISPYYPGNTTGDSGNCVFR